MCECGQPVWIKKTGECKRCYHKRYKETYVPKKDYAHDLCACGGTKSRQATVCKDCYTPPTKTKEEKAATRRANVRKRIERLGREAVKGKDTGKATRKARRRLKEHATYQYGMPNDYAKHIRRYYGDACLACGSTVNTEIDHVIPLALGGDHALYNMQVLCRSCNGAKGARDCTDYRPAQRLQKIIMLKGVSLDSAVHPAPVFICTKTSQKIQDFLRKEQI